MTDQKKIRQHSGAFPELGPETILDIVETGLGVSCTNLCRQFNSYINRVFELESVDGKGLVIKFYRPGRWSKKQCRRNMIFSLSCISVRFR